MAAFASDRERRLWSWAAAVLIAIYSTLGMTPMLAPYLAERAQLLALGFALCLLLVGAAILTQGLRVRPRGIEIGVALGVGAVFLLVFLRLSLPERSHLIEYGVVSLLIREALLERRRHGRGVRHVHWAALGWTCLAGIVDECIQLALPNREFEWIDIAFNCLAALMAVSGVALLNWVGRRRRT